jgi:DNA-binding CsgD family transcriptional regulator
VTRLLSRAELARLVRAMRRTGRTYAERHSEPRVLALVAEGATYREIAARLGIGRTRVARLYSRALERAKVGA